MSVRNHEVTSVHPLLDERGELIEPGWSRRLYQVYNRENIRAPKFRDRKSVV